MTVTEVRQTAVCGTCSWVGYADEEAGHPCNPRRVNELAGQVTFLAGQVAVLERRLAAAEHAFALAAGIRAGRDVITPGRPNRAAGPAPQVTGRASRAAKRTPERASCAVTVAPLRRAPTGGAA